MAGTAYPERVPLAGIVAIVVGLVVGVPLLIVALAALGPVGWIVAATALPLLTLTLLVLVGREREGDGRPPA